jgi:hypothetical protein
MSMGDSSRTIKLFLLFTVFDLRGVVKVSVTGSVWTVRVRDSVG